MSIEPFGSSGIKNMPIQSDTFIYTVLMMADMVVIAPKLDDFIYFVYALSVQ